MQEKGEKKYIYTVDSRYNDHPLQRPSHYNDQIENTQMIPNLNNVIFTFDITTVLDHSIRYNVRIQFSFHLYSAHFYPYPYPSTCDELVH